MQEVSSTLSFHSILFGNPAHRVDAAGAPAPAFFPDLNLDQVVGAITAGYREYDLEPFFHLPLPSVEAIAYRQEILRDLEDGVLFDGIGSFARKMRTMRGHLSRAARLRYRRQQQFWFLDAVQTYCDAVSGLARDLAAADLRSSGFRSFRESLSDYTRSSPFTALGTEVSGLKLGLDELRYRLHIHGNRIEISRYDDEVDYSAEVAATFARFQRRAVKDHFTEPPDHADMNYVEADILDRVARLHPEIFSALDRFCDQHRDYLDETVSVFDREVQFYVAWLRFARRIERAGLSFCYPELSTASKDVSARAAFDIALANKLIPEKSAVVCNDFHLSDPERVVVVSGPNQGGKTTFARTFGQLHYLARLGCQVPGTEARLYLFDQLFTHFEREENLQDLAGKLHDDLIRIHHILERATTGSILILNEIFTSTTLSDAVLLSRRVLERIVALDVLCVWVTFIDELASSGETTVSMVSTVVPENPAVRTYKVVRRPAGGLAYAVAIAEKYGLTYERLTKRMGS